ncbi:hypothetical protein ACIPEQ_14240 [Curtobacterium sp. NPDC087080]|uniref:hypothetical protein n=1 Tax=Curtobacterium sp. NPDC087080 TaxID=3363965 RepID=UPI0037F3250E
MTQYAVAPFTMSRIASLPGDALHFDQQLTTDLLEEGHRLQEQVDSISRQVADAVHVLVPTCSEGDRRALLGLRRDLHNRRPLTTVGLEAAERHGLDLEELVQRRAAVAVSRALIAKLADEDGTRAEERVREALRTPDVADALRLLSPGFFEALGKPAPAGSKRGRSALAFTSRAALKPSPLSTLTRVAVDGANLDDRVSTLSPVVASTVLRELATRRHALPTLQYRSAVRATGERLVASVETAEMTHGAVVFGRHPKRLHDADSDAALLSTWVGGTADELLRLADGGGWARAARWIASGAVSAVPPWTHDSRRPESALGELMLRSACTEVAAAGALLLQVGRDAQTLASTSGPSRSAVLRSIQDGLQQLASELDIDLPRQRLVNEDAGAVSRPTTSSSDLPRSLAALVRPTLFRSRVYDVIKDAFVAAHGAGGATHDVLGFLTECSLSRPFRGALQAARTADRTADAHVGRTGLPVGATTAPPTISAFVQTAHAHDDRTAVVNQLMPGVGGVVARFCALGDAPSTLVPMITGWVEQLYPDADDVRSVLPGVDVNPLQRAAAAAVPPLRGADLEEALLGIALAHDPETDVLEFVRNDGALVAPVPLGIVPAWTFEGPVGLLLALVDPWIDGSHITRESNPIRRAGRTERVERHPRRTDRSLVTRRQTWRLPVDSIPVQGNSTPGDFLTALHGWRTANGMPDEVFVRIHGDDPFDADTRKPIWMRFSSWYTVSAVWALLPGRHTLEVQESLPVRSGAERAVEHVITLGWPRPTPGPLRARHEIAVESRR